MTLSAVQKTTKTTHHLTSSAFHDPSVNLLQLLQLSINHKSLTLTQQIHSQILSSGSSQNSFLAAKLISAYSESQNPEFSKAVFDTSRHKNVYLWNTLINGYSKCHLYNEAFVMFNQMCRENDFADEFTFSTLCKISGDIGNLLHGKMVHCRSIRVGFVADTVLSNSIVSMYSKCGEISESRKVFDEMPQRNASSWNVLISAYSSTLGDDSCDGDVWKFVKDMQIEGLKPDAFTVSTLLPLCGGENGTWNYGRELHSFVVKIELDLGLGSDVHLGSCLIDMYSRNDKIDLARRVFDRMWIRNVYAWTAIINGYVQNGDSSEAFVLFQDMQFKGGIAPNRVSVVSVLPGCSSFAGLMGGKQIHGYVIRNELNSDVSVSNALIDMYAKCGSIKCARQVFEDNSFCNDAISWSSIISGYGLHGKGHDAVELYDKMLQLGIKPDMVTVVGVLSACNRSGLVMKGLEIYHSATNDYGVEPSVEICACVVDLLGQSGLLDRALDFIKAMPVKPGPSVWGALVGACVTYKNDEMRNLAYGFLAELEPDNPSNYISLSNVYASSNRWDVVARVRMTMKERGLRKMPGCSWIIINSETHCFYAADKTHQCHDLIYEMLHYLILTMKGDHCTSDLITSN